MVFCSIAVILSHLASSQDQPSFAKAQVVLVEHVSLLRFKRSDKQRNMLVVPNKEVRDPNQDPAGFLMTILRAREAKQEQLSVGRSGIIVIGPRLSPILDQWKVHGHTIDKHLYITVIAYRNPVRTNNALSTTAVLLYEFPGLDYKSVTISWVISSRGSDSEIITDTVNLTK